MSAASFIPPRDVFLFKDCAVAAIATGERAASLQAFRDKLLTVDLGCLFYHFWGSRLHSHFANRDYSNDFAIWAQHALHDNVLAERLNIIDPTDYENLENLRRELIDIVDERLDEQAFVPVTRKEQQFSFIRCQTVVFETAVKINHPRELVKALQHASTSTVFFHFIEAKRRNPDTFDDFSFWLTSFDGEYAALINQLKEIDPYFLNLSQLQKKLIETLSNYFKATSK